MPKRKRRTPIIIPPFWVVNPNYTDPRRAEKYTIAIDCEALKAGSERRMAEMDKLPKAVREAVHQYGQLLTAVQTRDVNAVREAYYRVTAKSYIDLNAAELDDLISNL